MPQLCRVPVEGLPQAFLPDFSAPFRRPKNLPSAAIAPAPRGDL
jgi:hypothetical protein